MKQRVVYIDGPDWGVDSLFMRRGWEITKNLDNCDAVCLTGGADIGPHIYNERALRGTYTNPSRDTRELALVERIDGSLPILGICRGGQLLNCLAGGSLWQDVNNHVGDHPATDLLTGERGVVSSLHHQMMRPTEAARLLMVASEATTFVCEKESVKVATPGHDIEALYYPKHKWLCFQGHPEYDDDVNAASFSSNSFFNYIDKLIFNEVQI